MSRPPAGWLRAVTAAPCAVPTDRAMESPSPTPSRSPVRAAMRRNGSNSEGTASSGMTGPLLAIWRYAAVSLLPVRSLIQPPGSLCRTALSTRFYVTGILNKDAYAPGIDSAILVGFPAAGHYLGFDGHPTTIYVRTTAADQAATASVDSLLGYQANPENPGYVTVSQPSAALTAQADAKGALDTLFLGLGAIALLVGAIGVANIMVISVLERRSEIGLRRALGATRGQVRIKFLAEAILLSLTGGAGGDIAGAAATASYARGHHELLVIPPEAWAGGLAAAVIIGAAAGLLPAIRAARLSPTRALWSI
jgi:putative ABC transport system permease protein